MAGIYIHIPFCRKKCIYCDFYSVGIRGLEDAYIDAVIAECRLRKDELHGNEVKTVYIGGGTPSLLSPELVKKLKNGIGDIVNLTSVEEFTIEVNPDDVTPQYISEVKATGINRVSMGVQSFVDTELQTINRRHDASQALAAIKAIKEAGIGNISIDLIYGLPGQTLESWKLSLDVALKQNVPHISCYNLSYEEGTRLYRMRDEGKISECNDELCVEMYRLMSNTLRSAGYEHYEVSNFALPGMYSRHNSSYWTGDVYLGLGASAHSFDGFERSYNIAEVRRYIADICQGNLVCEREKITLDERYDEYVMIHLRTSKGIDVSLVDSLFGKKYAMHFKKEAVRHVDANLLLENNGIYSLTEDGVMLSDMIIRDLMW